MSDKTSDKRLLPCPFCGGEARINVSTLGIVTVDCTVCHACSNAFFKKNDGEKEATQAWNTRKPMERILESLEEEMESLRNARHFFSEKMYTDYEALRKAQVLLEKELTLYKAIEIVKEEMEE